MGQQAEEALTGSSCLDHGAERTKCVASEMGKQAEEALAGSSFPNHGAERVGAAGCMPSVQGEHGSCCDSSDGDAEVDDPRELAAREQLATLTVLEYLQMPRWAEAFSLSKPPTGLNTLTLETYALAQCPRPAPPQ